MKNNLPVWVICFVVFLLCLSAFLFLRASDEYRWSDWGAGDAQTMLSLNHWEKSGWLANKFLFIPQGYAKVVGLLDDPQLRHHAHGISAPTPHNVGPRLRYTHYPSGYLIPYAILFKWGHGNIFLLRGLSIVFSVSALALMYILFSTIIAPKVAFLAVFFYGLSTPFLGYADSLANQPLDDLFRFAFMLCTALSTRTVSGRLRRALVICAWGIEFFLSLSSFDSVFFVFAWLIGWDFVERRRFRWKIYFGFALAPLLAHSLGFLQNVWYLGLNNAVIDAKDTLLMKSWPYSAASRLVALVYIVATVFSNLYKPLDLLVILAVFYILYRKFILARQKGKNCGRASIQILGPLGTPDFSPAGSIMSKNEDAELPSLRLLAVLGLCGLTFIFIFPVAATMRYEPRQVAPFVAVLISGCTWSFLKESGFAIRNKPEYKRKIYLSLFGLTLTIFWLFFVFSEREPAFDSLKIKNHPDVLLAKRIKPIPTIYDPVFFSVGGFSAFLNPRYVPGYPQIQPIVEYHIGSKPILCFNQPEALAADLSYMLHYSQDKFSPILVAENLADIEKVLFVLSAQGVLKEEQERIYYIRGKYVMVLSRSLKWK